MMSRLKAKAYGHLILQLLYVGRKELDHLAAIGADHMIVVFVIVMVFVVGLAVAETNLTRKAGLGQEFYRPIDRCQADRRIFPVYKAVEILAREMFFRPEECLKYQVTLVCLS